MVNITKFGAFVNILPGRDGLLHISKIGQGKRVERVEDVLELGQPVEVRVDDIDPQGKVSLSLAGEAPAGASSGGEARNGRGESRGDGRGDSGGRSRPRGDHADPGDRPDRGRRRPSRVPGPDRCRLVRGRLRGRAGPGVRRSGPGRGRVVRSPQRGWRRRPGWSPPPLSTHAGGVTGPRRRPTTPIGGPMRPGRRMIRTEILPSGLALVTERMDDARSVCIGFWVGTGSRDEDAGRGRRVPLPRAPAVQGDRRPVASAIAEAVDEVGGRLQRLHHQGVHLLLHPAAGRAPPAGAGHPLGHHVAAGPPSRRPGCRAPGHPGRDPDARRRALGRGRRAELGRCCSPITRWAGRCWAARSRCRP